MKLGVSSWIECPFLDITVDGDFCKAREKLKELPLKERKECVDLGHKTCPLVEGVEIVIGTQCDKAGGESE